MTSLNDTRRNFTGQSDILLHIVTSNLSSNATTRFPRRDISGDCDRETLINVTMSITSVFLVLGLIGNPLVIILHRHMPIKVTSTRIIFMVIAICDTVNLLHLPLRNVLAWIANVSYSKSYPFGYFNSVSSTTSNCLIATVSVERYIRVFGKRPIGSQSSKKFAVFICTAIVLIFSVAFIGLALPIKRNTNDAFDSYRKFVYWLVFTANTITPTIGVVVSNVFFIRQLHSRRSQHRRDMKQSGGTVTSHAISSNNMKSITLSFILISSIALFCHIPIGVVTLRRHYPPVCGIDVNLLTLFVAINHSVNFYIYFPVFSSLKRIIKCHDSPKTRTSSQNRSNVSCTSSTPNPNTTSGNIFGISYTPTQSIKSKENT